MATPTTAPSDYPLNAAAFVHRYPPFNALDAADIDWLLPRLRARDVPAEVRVAGWDMGTPADLHMLVRGRVRVIESRNSNPLPGEGSMLSAGECFPIGALSGRRAPGNAYITDEPCHFLLLPVDDFHALLNRSAVFTRYCSSYLSALVSQSRKQLQAYFSQQAGEQQSLALELAQLVKRRPVSVQADSPLRCTLELMGRERIGSIIVVDAANSAVGIFTQSDVLRRVVLGGADLDGPIAAAMTLNPATLRDTASAYDAMMTMAARGIRHLVVVDEVGSVCGVVSERDLFALQRISLNNLRKAIDSATTTEALQRVLVDVRQAAFNMVAQGVAAEQLTQFISSQNDAVTVRVLEINLARHDLQDIEWTWLAFGSEGREEQTLATDQDNGIVFLAAAPEREAVRARLLAFAQAVNQDLDRCGFPLCKGNIMAGNPQWCLTLEEWQACFSRWVEIPEPQALLNATIFFDLRALYGRADLAAAMYAHLFALTRDNSLFQRMLAQNALTVSPPLGVFRDFVTESDEEGNAFIDLKKFGARLFVDAARVLALVHGIDSPATCSRLRRCAELPNGLGDEVNALIDAFNFIQLLRLRHQHLEEGHGRAGDNRIFIGRLNDLERRILKESFRQARALQQRLKMNYQL